MCIVIDVLFWGYEWSDVFVYIELRNPLLQGVLDRCVYAVDILRLREIAVGSGNIYVYQRIDGTLPIARTSDQLERNDPLFVVVGNSFVDVQRLLVLGADLVDETIHVVSGRRNDGRVTILVYDPTPEGAVDWF